MARGLSVQFVEKTPRHYDDPLPPPAIKVFQSSKGCDDSAISSSSSSTKEPEVVKPAKYKRRVSFDTMVHTPGDLGENSRSSTTKHTEDYSIYSVASRNTQFKTTTSSRTYLCSLNSKAKSMLALQWLLDTLAGNGDEIICLKLYDDKELAGTRDEHLKHQQEAQKILQKVIEMVPSGIALSIVVELGLGKVKTIVYQTLFLYQPSIVVVGANESAFKTVNMFSNPHKSISKYLIMKSPVPVIIVTPRLLGLEKYFDYYADDAEKKKHYKSFQSSLRRSSISAGSGAANANSSGLHSLPSLSPSVTRSSNRNSILGYSYPQISSFSSYIVGTPSPGSDSRTSFDFSAHPHPTGLPAGPEPDGMVKESSNSSDTNVTQKDYSQDPNAFFNRFMDEIRATSQTIEDEYVARRRWSVRRGSSGSLRSLDSRSSLDSRDSRDSRDSFEASDDSGQSLETAMSENSGSEKHKKRKGKKHRRGLGFLNMLRRNSQ